MQCMRCGYDNKDEAKYCSECGLDLQANVSDNGAVNREQSYSQRGGSMIGEGCLVMFFYIGLPVARLTATEKGITITVPWKHYYFDKASVTAVRQYNKSGGVFYKGVQILHTNNKYPPFVLFLSFRRKRLMSELQRLGYTIQDGVSMWKDVIGG